MAGQDMTGRGRAGQDMIGPNEDSVQTVKSMTVTVTAVLQQ